MSNNIICALKNQIERIESLLGSQEWNISLNEDDIVLVLDTILDEEQFDLLKKYDLLEKIIYKNNDFDIRTMQSDDIFSILVYADSSMEKYDEFCSLIINKIIYEDSLSMKDRISTSDLIGYGSRYNE